MADPDTLNDLSILQSYLKALLADQHPDLPSFSGPEWEPILRHLRSVQTYLTITRQSMSDRQALYDEVKQRLTENQKRLYHTEDQLKQNKEKLAQNEYKVLEYMLALQHINLIQRRVQGLLNIDSLLSEVTALLTAHLCVHRGFFLKQDLQSQSMKVLSAIQCQFKEGECVDSGPLWQLLQTHDMAKAPEMSQEEIEIPILRLSGTEGAIYGHAFQSALVVPVWIERELWGALFLFDKEERLRKGAREAFSQFSEIDELVLQNVVAFLQKDLWNAHLFEMATVDGLSQLYVRRYFESRLEDEIRRVRRHEGQFALLMIDIDHFKPFNDTYGHLLGDEVIQQVAATIKQQLRAGTDLPGRYGGEEMVVLLAETPPEGARVVAERIRQAVAELQISALGSKPLPHVTVSIGVSGFPLHGEDLRSLQEAADQALYWAKGNGRNRVELYEVQHDSP